MRDRPSVRKSNNRLIVVDGDANEMYEAGDIIKTWTKTGPGRARIPVIGNEGYLTDVRASYSNHALTSLAPLPDGSTPGEPAHIEVLYRKLGKAVYESVPKKYRSRVAGEFRKINNNEAGMDGWGSLCDYSSGDNCVIFTPEQPPTRTLTIPGLCKDVEMSEETYQNIKKQLGESQAGKGNG